jgi:hypothetical protein
LHAHGSPTSTTDRGPHAGPTPPPPPVPSPSRATQQRPTSTEAAPLLVKPPLLRSSCHQGPQLLIHLATRRVRPHPCPIPSSLKSRQPATMAHSVATFPPHPSFTTERAATFPPSGEPISPDLDAGARHHPLEFGWRSRLPLLPR